MAKRSIGIPRVYCDLGLYLKAMGYYDGYSMNPYLVTKDKNPFTMNPSNMNTYTTSNEWLDFKYKIKYHDDAEKNKNLNLLLGYGSTSFYGGVLGHDIGYNTTNPHWFDFSYIDTNDVEYEMDLRTNIFNNHWYGGGYNGAEWDGFTIRHLHDPFSTNDTDALKIKEMRIRFTGNIVGINMKIGALTWGRYFNLPRCDLQATINHEYEGLDHKSTLGGSTLLNKKHTGQKMWGDLPAWAIKNRADVDGIDFKAVSNVPRRSWKLKMSFISDDDLFNQTENQNKFFDFYSTSQSYGARHFEFFSLTLNVNLHFIFCPDKDADDLEFAICRISKPPVFKEVAKNLWTTQFTIVESY